MQWNSNEHKLAHGQNEIAEGCDLHLGTQAGIHLAIWPPCHILSPNTQTPTLASPSKYTWLLFLCCSIDTESEFMIKLFHSWEQTRVILAIVSQNIPRLGAHAKWHQQSKHPHVQPWNSTTKGAFGKQMPSWINWETQHWQPNETVTMS